MFRDFIGHFQILSNYNAICKVIFIDFGGALGILVKRSVTTGTNWLPFSESSEEVPGCLFQLNTMEHFPRTAVGVVIATQMDFSDSFATISHSRENVNMHVWPVTFSSHQFLCISSMPVSCKWYMMGVIWKTYLYTHRNDFLFCDIDGCGRNQTPIHI